MTDSQHHRTDTRPGVSRRSFAQASAGVAGVGLLGSLLAACTKVSTPSDNKDSGNSDSKTLNVLSSSYGNVIPWTTQGYASQKFWANQFNVNLTQLDPGGDPGKQLSQIQDAAAKKWDLVVLNGIIQGNLSTAAQRFIDAGTPVISYLSDVALETKPVDGLLTTIEADHYQMGFDMTTKLCNALKGKGKGKIIETQGIAGGSNVIDRHRGFADAVKAFPDIEVLASDYGNFTTDKSQALWQSYVTKYPVIDGAFCHNEDMAFGAFNALKAANRQDKTLLTGVDGTVRGCQAVLNGQLFATVRHAASQIYAWPVIVGAMHVRKLVGEIPSKVIVNSPIVDKTNADSVIFLQGANVDLL
ncbi:substrate-binding domain-containing protein [Amycolatopsis thermoflava]|uniref:sugar ABC transporter substrate-binding protein n=1 Tax=Amycolatopsis thermoflava TaxID=84480 RepID=UPI003EB8891C